MSEESEDVQPEFHCDNNYAKSLQEILPVERRETSISKSVGTSRVAASVEPHHHRQTAGKPTRRPKVHKKAVLGADDVIVGVQLRTPVSLSGGGENPAPWIVWNGRSKPQCSDWRLRVW